MAKKKNKKQIKKKVSKKIRIRTIKKAVKPKSRKLPGKRIKVKTIIEPKTENIYGSVLRPEIKLPEAAINSDLNFSPVANLAIAEIPIQTAEIVPEQKICALNNLEFDEDYAQADEIEILSEADQSEYRAAEPFDNLSPRQKKIIMYIAVSSVMVILIGFWFVGLRDSLGQSFKNSNLNGDNESMQLKQSLDDLNRELSNFKTQIENKQQTTADFANQAKQILIQQKIKETIADKMKEQLSNSNLNAAINLNLNAANNIP